MRLMIQAVIAATLIALATPAHAVNCRDVEVKTTGGADFTGISIAAGAVTTAMMPIDIYSVATLHLDVTDASNTITNIRLSIRVSNSLTGTPRVYPDCSTVSPVMTCKTLVIDWDPRDPLVGEGKNWVLPMPTQYEFFDITATPTGEGAGDELSLLLRGCQ